MSAGASCLRITCSTLNDSPKADFQAGLFVTNIAPQKKKNICFSFPRARVLHNAALARDPRPPFCPFRTRSPRRPVIVAFEVQLRGKHVAARPSDPSPLTTHPPEPLATKRKTPTTPKKLERQQTRNRLPPKTKRQQARASRGGGKLNPHSLRTSLDYEPLMASFVVLG